MLQLTTCSFWHSRCDLYNKIAAALHLKISMVAPVSKAFVERIFSLCGMLTNGRRNRMRRSLETMAFLKLNEHIV